MTERQEVPRIRYVVEGDDEILIWWCEKCMTGGEVPESEGFLRTEEELKAKHPAQCRVAEWKRPVGVRRK